MQSSHRHSIRNEHTLVLRSRSSAPVQPLKIGSKHIRIGESRGSPPRREARAPDPVAMRRPHASSQRAQRAYPTEGSSDLLVAFGIDSMLGRMVARVLVWLMLMQPVYVAFAMDVEEVSGVSTSETEVVAEESASTNDMESTEVLNDEVVDVPNDLEDESPFTAAESVASTDTGTEAGDPGSIADEMPVTETNPSVTDEERALGDETAPDTGSTTDTSGTSTPDNTSNSDQQPSTESLGEESGPSDGTTASATSTDDMTVATSTASSSDEVLVDDTTLVVQDPQSKYSFGEGDCTVVAEGEFYCVATDLMRQPTGDPRVYAEKDREGDREIFYFDGVDVKRLTNNGYDDFAPAFDETTKRVVWQAMISDRLQVMVYDIEENTTRQITTGRHNSSNPDIEGDLVVWQEWIDTNWEVMMTNVNTGGAPFEIEQLSDNAVHDMFPRVYENLVTWQREKGGSWEVILYDLSTKEVRALPKDENTKYENPRFVLLFDSKHDNGDVETIGYDLESGDMMELGTKANREPFVPVSPKEEVPDAPVQQSASSTQVKVSGREDDGGDPLQ